MSDALYPLSDAAEVQTLGCRMLGEFLALRRVVYAEVTGDDFRVQAGYEPGVSALSYRGVLSDLPRPWSEAVRRLESFVVADVAGEDQLSPSERQWFLAQGTAALAAVGVGKDGILSAQIEAHRSDPNPWSEDELSLLRMFGERLQTAIERVEAAEVLRLSEGRYRTLFDAIDQGFCLVEVLFDEHERPCDYRFLEVNPAFVTHTGLTNVEGRTIREIEPEHEQHWFDIYGRIALTGQAERFEHAATNLGRLYEVYATRVDPPAQRHLAVLFSDITERRKAEMEIAAADARFRLMVENAREYVIFSTDLDRRVTSWNIGAERILGYTEEEILGRSADVIFTAEDQADGAPGLEAATSLEKGRSSDERWHVRKNGERFWGSGVMMAMRNDHGEAMGLLKIFRDDTNAMQARHDLETSREQLMQALHENKVARAEVEAASWAKDRFLAVLSHELRTPLAPVLVTLKTLARRRDTTDAIRAGLELIGRNVRVEARLIDDLLDVTRIGSGKLEVELAPMDLHAAIREAIDISMGDLRRKRQKLSVDLHAESSYLEGDATRLKQVIWNLLKNASKFTPDGKRIRLETRNNGEQILIEVSDEGIGIEAENLETVFDAFAQGGREITKQYGGLGLGLAISKATIEAHGGSIHVQSPGRGQGAVFTVALPLHSHGAAPDGGGSSPVR